MTTINERLQKIVDELFKGNKTAFAKAINKAPTTISNILGPRKTIPSVDIMESIANSIEDINSLWLMTGKGNMLSDTLILDEVVPANIHIMNVPLVDQYAYAGYLNGYNDTTYMEHLPTLPFIVEHEGQGHYIAFEVKGDSMDDGSIESYVDGDKLFCREIMPHLWTCAPLHIKKWDFVIVHREGILIKRILKHDVENHKITIHSLNPYYEDREIDLQDVKQIFNVIEIQRNKRR